MGWDWTLHDRILIHLSHIRLSIIFCLVFSAKSEWIVLFNCDCEGDVLIVRVWVSEWVFTQFILFYVILCVYLAQMCVYLWFVCCVYYYFFFISLFASMTFFSHFFVFFLFCISYSLLSFTLIFSSHHVTCGLVCDVLCLWCDTQGVIENCGL